MIPTAGPNILCDPLPLTPAPVRRLSPRLLKSRDMVQLVEANDDFRRRCRKPRTANGAEAIELLTGQAIEFHARSSQALLSPLMVRSATCLRVTLGSVSVIPVGGSTRCGGGRRGSLLDEDE